MKYFDHKTAVYLLLAAAVTLPSASCSSEPDTPDSGAITEEYTETADAPAVYTPEHYASLLPDEYFYVNTDLPQVVIETDGRISGRRYTSASAAVISFVDGEVRVIDADDAEVKIRGNTSSDTPKQQLAVRFQSKLPLLGMDSGRRWVLNGSVFDKSLMRSKLVCDISAQLRLPYASRGEYCELWLNGEYRGSYLLMEPVTDGKGRVDIDIENGDFLLECCVNRTEPGVTYFTSPIFGIRFELDKPESTDGDGMGWLDSFFTSFETALNSLDHEKYSEYIDIDSFVDFYILNELFKDIDFGEFSTRYFIKDGVLYAGPPWDFDLSMGNVSYAEFKYLEYHNDVTEDGRELHDMEGDSAEGFWCRTGWYKKLFEDEYFRDLVTARYDELQPLIKSIYEGDGNLIDLYKERYGASFARNFEIWKVSEPYGVYENQTPKATLDSNIGVLRRWLTRRNEWLSAHMADPDVTPALHLLRPEYQPH